MSIFAADGRMLPTPFAGPSAVDLAAPMLIPTVATISPALGDASGGIAVTITGTNFFSVTGVTINGVPCTSVVVVNPTTITAVTPAIAASLVARDVSVTNAGGTGTDAGAYTSWSPTLIGGIQLWLRADLGVTIGTGVSAWADQSGVGDANRNAAQATGANQPTFNASDAAYNNKKTISFLAASNQWLRSGAWSVALAQPCSIFIVGNADGTIAAQEFIDGNANRLILDSNENSSNRFEAFGGSFLSTGAPLSAAPMVLGAAFNGGSTKTYVSALTPTATGAAGANSLDAMAIGSVYPGGAVSLNGKIAEVLAFNSALTAPQIASLFTYINGRYGITIGP